MRALQALALPFVVLSLALSFVVLLHPSGLARADGPPPFVIVVHPDSPITSADRDLLSEAFLKKITEWPGGEIIRPVDQASDASVRARFSDAVLKRTVAAVRAYWQQQIFAGRDVPPPEVGSDEAVVRYVLKYRGAVGYVSGATPIDRVRVVRVD